MATWRKVIVSGSTANLAALQVDNLTSGQVVIGGGQAGNLSTTAINGTGNIVATTNATGLTHSGSFSGSFSGAITTALQNASKPYFVAYDITTGALSYASTGSFTATSASYAFTASYINPLNQGLVQITGSLGVTGGITGSLLGTSSYAAQAASASYWSGSTAYAQTSSVAISASFASTAFFVTASNVFGPYGASSILSSSYALTASYAANGGALSNALTFGTGLSGSSPTFNGATAVNVAVSGAATLTTNLVTKWTGTGFANSSITDSSLVTINNSGGVYVQQGGIDVSGSSVFHNAVVVQGDLTVQGTASFQNSTSLLIADQFFLINSGSATFQDSGMIINTGNAQNSGSAFYLETSGTTSGSVKYGRFALAADILPGATTATADEYMVSSKLSVGPPTSSASPSWGGNLGSGNMWVNTSNGDIYIFS